MSEQTLYPARPAPRRSSSESFANRFLVERLLGEGGFARVHLATDTRVGRYVALKELTDVAAASPEVVERFRREPRAAAALNHPAIVQVYDVLDEPQRGPIMVMEYAAGGDLDAHIQARGPLSPAEAAAFFAPIAEALARAHEKGIIHRDIKPKNILLTEHGNPKLADFGIAHLDDPGGKMTSEQMRMGTLEYMAPEQRGSAVLAGPAADIYSLGASIYRAVTGLSPRVLRLEKIPASLRAIVARCLEEDSSQRYQNADLLARELAELSGDRSRAGENKPRRPIVLWVAAPLTVAIVAVTAFYEAPLKPTRPQVITAEPVQVVAAEPAEPAEKPLTSAELSELEELQQKLGRLSGAGADTMLLATLGRARELKDAHPNAKQVAEFLRAAQRVPAYSRAVVQRRRAIVDELYGKEPDLDQVRKKLEEMRLLDPDDELVRRSSEWAL